MERQAKDGTFYRKVGEDQWEPVTRQARDGTTYRKVGKDQWSPLESQVDPSSGVSRTESALRGAAQGATLGFGDELVGAARGVYDDARSFFGGPSTASGVKPQYDEHGRLINMDELGSGTYKQHRDTARARNEAAREANPWTYGGAEFGGAVASAPVPGLNIARGASLGRVAAQSGAAGGIAGAGYSEAEDLGGMARDTAVGAGLGAGLGAGVHQAASRFLGRGAAAQGGRAGAKAKQAIDAGQDQAARVGAQAGADARASVSGGALDFEQSGQLFDFKPPQSLDELAGWRPPAPDTGKLVGGKRLQEITQVVPDLQVKPLQYHYQMFDNPKAMKQMKLQFENLPTESAQQIAAYHQAMVGESASKIRQTVNKMSGGVEPRNIGDAGDHFINIAKNNYDLEREMLSPAFEMLNRTRSRVSASEAKDLIQGIGANTKLGKLLEQNPQTGRFTLKANAPRSGLSDKEHKILSRVIDDLNDGMSFQDLQKAREFLRKQMDPQNYQATAEIAKVRSLMLGQMEELAAKRGPGVGETFKRYAINERNRESVERIIGGKIESLDQMFAANPERVVNKIFSNPNHTKIVRDFIGEEAVQEMAASYVNHGIKSAFDSTQGFKPHIVRNWLQRNEAFVRNNLDPQDAQRLHALADYGYLGKRFLDEVNPSGTAASLQATIEPKSMMTRLSRGDIIGAVTSQTVGRVDAAMKQRQAIRALNEALADIPESQKPRILGEIFDQLSNNRGALATAAGVKGGASAGGGGSQAVIPMVAEADQQEPSTFAHTSPQKMATPPLKGKAKWASDGIDKVIKAHPGAAEFLEANRDQILADEKTRELFIRASSLKPGTKAMDKVIEQIDMQLQQGEN